MASFQQKNQHLMWRAGFGSATSDVTALVINNPTRYYTAIEKASTKLPQFINVAEELLAAAGMAGLGVARTAASNGARSSRRATPLFSPLLKELNSYHPQRW